MMTLVWEVPLADSEKIVLLALADCANDEGHCWPSMATLAKKCSKSDRTVQACIQTLCSKGHLTRREVPGRGCNYTVHPIVRLATPEAVSPRSSFAPEVSAPRKDCATPPKPVRATPEAASDKPSKNHKEPSEDSSAEPTPLTKQEVIEAWQTRMVPQGFPAIRKMTGQRDRLLNARLRDSTLDEWMTVFAAMERSAFLRGENDRGWRADFDFLLQPKSFTKLLEGAYDH
jgi:hypothetical protein